jgi:hypothetical protein
MRQEVWQKSINSKSQDEINEMNFKKGTGNMNRLFNSNPIMKEVPGILYYIHFYNDTTSFWKIGITSKSINQRFGDTVYKHNLKMNILYENQNSFYNCYKEEQRILKEFKNNRIRIDCNGFKTTEAFNKGIYEII